MNLVKMLKNQLSPELTKQYKYIQERRKVTPITESKAGDCKFQQNCKQCPIVSECLEIKYREERTAMSLNKDI